MAAGLTRATFRLIAITVAAVSCQPAAPEKALVVHLAETSPAPGLTASIVPTTGETLYLHPEPVLTARDVHEAEVKSDPFGAPTLELTFTPAGSRRLSDVTLQNQGKRLAFVRHSAVLVAPVIYAPITEGTAVVGGAGLGDEIERLAKELQKR